MGETQDSIARISLFDLITPSRVDPRGNVEVRPDELVVMVLVEADLVSDEVLSRMLAMMSYLGFLCFMLAHRRLHNGYRVREGRNSPAGSRLVIP